MANKADFIVRNCLDKTINVTCRHNGRGEAPVIIAAKEINRENGGKTRYHRKKIPVAGPEVTMYIQPPEGIDIKDCPIQVKSDVDLSVTYSRSRSCWMLNIVANDLPSTVPTTTNVNVGEDRPG